MLRFALAFSLLTGLISTYPATAAEIKQPATAAHTLPALPYAYEALNPAIDTETMQIHHQKHHQAYINNLNQAIAGTHAAHLSLEALLAEVSKWPEAVRNNAGGHWNHSFFWQSLTPPTSYKAPQGELKAAIEKQFGSLEKFQQQFDAAGLKRFGSGWVWLIRKSDGTLAITTTPNQDNPLMDAVSEKGTPLLGCDLWEHAYYLRYQNRRGDYLKAFWQIVNWPQAEARFSHK